MYVNMLSTLYEYVCVMHISTDVEQNELNIYWNSNGTIIKKRKKTEHADADQRRRMQKLKTLKCHCQLDTSKRGIT